MTLKAAIMYKAEVFHYRHIDMFEFCMSATSDLLRNKIPIIIRRAVIGTWSLYVFLPALHTFFQMQSGG